MLLYYPAQFLFLRGVFWREPGDSAGQPFPRMFMQSAWLNINPCARDKTLHSAAMLPCFCDGLSPLLGKEKQEKSDNERKGGNKGKWRHVFLRGDWPMGHSLGSAGWEVSFMSQGCSLAPQAWLPFWAQCKAWGTALRCSLCFSHPSPQAVYFPNFLCASPISSICPGRNCSYKNYIPFLKLPQLLIA